MKQWNSVDEALDFAIANEQEAHDFYAGLAGKAEKPWMAAVFEGFAKEELGHKAKLEGVKKGNLLKPSEKKIADLKIGDYLVDVDPSGELDYQQALIVAMKKEKAAFKLYSDIAAAMTDPGLRETFQALAQEEAKHKLRFEVEYDDFVLTDN
jgi:rubrerythrin